MNIALLGYGKMGRMIENRSALKGHKITGIITSDTREEDKVFFLNHADIAIEFTAPEQAVDNILLCHSLGTPVVTGTTGWLQRLPELKSNLSPNARLFYASNYSIGVNIFFEANKYLARLIGVDLSYDIKIIEKHHINKVDAPSGTAITLSEKIIEGLCSDKYDGWSLDADSKNKVHIVAIREGAEIGYHQSIYNSPTDEIIISHRAINREGFADGAILAAEWLVQQPEGVYNMSDMLKITS